MGGVGDGGGDGDGDGGATGGTNPSGGAGTGGDTGGRSGGGTGGGTGGTPVVVDVLIEDMQHADSANYFNDPFYGGWDRYGQKSSDDDCINDAEWASATVAGMFQGRTGGDDDDLALHVVADQLDCWGIGTYFTLKQLSSAASAVDLTTLKGISFWAKAAGSETSLRIALEDDYSHAETCSSGCDKHAVSVQPIGLTDEWKQFNIALSSFIREPALNEEEVFAIHFQMDPSGETVDFMIDDIYTY